MLSQTDNQMLRVSGRKRIAVIGGGIAGLAAAYKVVCEAKERQEPIDVWLFEGSPRLGGCISTYNLDETTLELGPDAFITEKPAALDLCKKLGLEKYLIPTDDKNRRTFVARDQKLHPVPDGFMMMAPTKMLPFFNSPLFSLEGKLRMLQDMFIPAPTDGRDESLTQFVERRLGREALDRLIQPLVGGIYTADPDKLSVQAALPRIAALEQKHGSLIKGLAAGAKTKKSESGARYSMFMSLEGGMGMLVDALVKALPHDCINTHSLVSRVRRCQPGWELEFYDGKKRTVDGVIIATASFHASDIVQDLDRSLSDSLKKIEYASSAVMNMVYKRSSIPHPLDAFGFVVPRTEKRTALACSFTSVKFPSRTTPDKAILRVFVGGALQPDVYDLSDEHIECLLWEDLHTYLGIRALPQLSVISRYPRAMPQYNVGHLTLVKQIENMLERHQGLQLAGAAYYGVGIPDCIASGEKAAQAVLAHTDSLKQA